MPGGLQQTDQAPPLIPMAFGAIVFVMAGFWLLAHGNMSLLLAMLLAVCFLGIHSVNKNAAIYMTLVYLLFLGDIRRVWGLLYGFPLNDPLVVVGAVFAIAVAFPLLFSARVSDTLSKLCLGLLLVMFLQIFNPAQGGLLVGVSGMIYTMAPLLWFWIGRTYGSEVVMRTVMQKILVPTAVIAGAYGYYQNTIGLNAWQQAWLDHVGKSYVALHLGHSIRAFGFSPSSSEYINLLGMATIVALVGFIAGRRWMIFPIVILLPSLFLAGSRGGVVRVLFASAMAFSFSGRKRKASTLRFVVAIAFGVGGLALVLSGVGGESKKQADTAAGAAITHQVQGFNDPLHSTAAGHSGEIIAAVGAALRHPTGYGLGSTSIASRLSDGQSSDITSSEFDLTDAFLALGLPGGILYLSLIVSMYRASVRYIGFGPRDLSLSMFGILAAFLGDWLFPGEYANGPILWVLAGCVVRAVVKDDQAQALEKKRVAELELQALAVAA